MTYYSDAQEMVRQLGTHLGIGNLAFDDHKFCAVSLGEKIVINMQYIAEANSLIVHSCVGVLTPEHDKHETLMALLAANCLWKETAGATLGIDRESKLIMLSYAITLPIANIAAFVPMFMKFTETVEDWMKRLGVWDIEVPEHVREQYHQQLQGAKKGGQHQQHGHHHKHH